MYTSSHALFTIIFVLGVFILPASEARAQGMIKLLSKAQGNQRCTGGKHDSGAPARFDSRRISKAQTTRLTYLARELRGLVPRLEKKHRELTRIYPALNRSIVFVRKNSAPMVRNGRLVQNKQFINALYGPGGRLRCLVVDARSHTLRRADLWTRRIVRLRFEGENLRVEFETLRKNMRVYSGDERIQPRARIKILRIALRHVRDLIYTADFITAEHVRRRGIIRANEKRAETDRTIIRRARRSPVRP